MVLKNEKRGLFGRKAKILVVEDNEVDRTLVEKTLQRSYDVSCVESGEEALAAIKADKPDVIILDWNLPGMPGVELCRRLKEDDQTSPIPVLFLTGEDKPVRMVEAFEMDAENYLTKPINPGVLTSQIKAILEDRAQV